MALLKYNYSKDMEDLIFIYLENYSHGNLSPNEEYDEISDSKFDGNKKLKKLVEDNFMDNFDFNKRLFEFLKNKKLLNSNKQKIFMLDLETKLFESLYGIKYINRYGEEKKVQKTNTGFAFNQLLEVIDALPFRKLEYIVPHLKASDTLLWFEYIQSKQDRENYNINCWCIYAVLLHNNSKEVFEQLFEFLKTNFCSITNTDIEKMPFDFERIADNFWAVYFSSEIQTLYRINELLKLLKISLKEIQKAVLKYPIENYVKHYERLKFNEDIDKYFMQDKIFEAHIIESNKYWQEQREKHEEELQKKLLDNGEYQQRIQNEANYKRICEDSLKTLATKQDFYNVFICEKIYEEANQNKLHEVLSDEQYAKLINFIEDDFIKDETYIKIKNSINANRYSLSPTAFYIYLFQDSDSHKVSNLIQSKEDFEKIFFHTFKFHKIKEKYFVLLAREYFNYFIASIQELIKLSLEQSENKDIVDLYDFIKIMKEIGRFDKNNLSKLIQNLLYLDKNIFESIKEKYNVEQILKIISLDEQSYDFIDELRIIDKDRANLYFEYLLKIDSKVTLDNYFIEYQKEPTYIKLYKLKKLYADIKNKLGIKVKDNDEKNKYDKPNINQSKIKLFKDLILALKNSVKNEDLEDKYIFNIISDYHEFFNEYERHTGVYSPDIYDNMNEYINSIFHYLSATSSHIEVLEKLSKSIDFKLSTRAKYHLELAYNNQNKDRNYTNKHYKEIFDKENIVNKNNIVINAGDKNNININTGIQTNNSTSSNSKNDKWWNNWTIISLIVSFLSGGLIYWTLGNKLVSIIASIIVFLIMFLNNPKRRFFRMAWICILIGSSQFLSYSGIFIIPENKFIHGYLKIGENSIPWFGVMMIIVALILFWFDAKNEK
jgi:hypothetical protein